MRIPFQVAPFRFRVTQLLQEIGQENEAHSGVDEADEPAHFRWQRRNKIDGQDSEQRERKYEDDELVRPDFITTRFLWHGLSL